MRALRRSCEGWGNREGSTSLRGADLGCDAAVTEASADLQWSSGAEVFFLNWGDGAGPLHVPFPQVAPGCRLPRESRAALFDWEQFLRRRSTMKHQQIAVPAAEGTGVQPAEASAATLMLWVMAKWQVLKKGVVLEERSSPLFLCSVPLPSEGRSRSGEWCVSVMGVGEQEWGGRCYLPLPVLSTLGWITKALGKRGQVDSDFVSLSRRGWLMGNVSHSFPLKKISCPFSGKLK